MQFTPVKRRRKDSGTDSATPSTTTNRCRLLRHPQSYSLEIQHGCFRISCGGSKPVKARLASSNILYQRHHNQEPDIQQVQMFRTSTSQRDQSKVKVRTSHPREHHLYVVEFKSSTVSDVFRRVHHRSWLMSRCQRVQVYVVVATINPDVE